MIRSGDSHKKETANKKIEQDRLQIILNDLLKDEENKYCADCEAKGPRWASWNLGVFLCIRCAGIHRNLGVHVSKVKSVNLDMWTPEQVQSVRVFGNSVAKAVYEDHLPDHFRRPQTDSSLESFIRAKYEHKRYAMKDWQPPKIDVKPLLAELENFHARKKVCSSPAFASLNKTPNNLVSDVKSRTLKNSKSGSSGHGRRSKNNSVSEDKKPNETSLDHHQTKITNGSSLADDLLELTMTPPTGSATQPTSTCLIDDSLSCEFGSFAVAAGHAPPTSNDDWSVNNTTTTTAGADLLNAFGGAAVAASLALNNERALLDTNAKGANEKKTKDDILALYGSNSSLSVLSNANNASQTQQTLGMMPPSSRQNMNLFGGQFNTTPQNAPTSTFGSSNFLPQTVAAFAAFNPFNQSAQAEYNFDPPTTAVDQANQQTTRLKAVQDQLAALQSQKVTSSSNKCVLTANGSSSTTISNDLWQ